MKYIQEIDSYQKVRAVRLGSRIQQFYQNKLPFWVQQKDCTNSRNEQR